jgi:hypothetical protein
MSRCCGERRSVPNPHQRRNGGNGQTSTFRAAERLHQAAVSKGLAEHRVRSFLIRRQGGQGSSETTEGRNLPRIAMKRFTDWASNAPKQCPMWNLDGRHQRTDIFLPVERGDHAQDAVDRSIGHQATCIHAKLPQQIGLGHGVLRHSPHVRHGK